MSIEHRDNDNPKGNPKYAKQIYSLAVFHHIFHMDWFRLELRLPL
jgi:hypothetical protein